MPSSGSGSAASAVGSGSYLTPPVDDIKAWTGLNGTMTRLTEGELDTELALRVVDGEDDMFMRPNVGETYRSRTDLTAGQVRVLQRAVSHRTAAVVLFRVLTGKATGTHAPLRMEAADSIRELIADHEEAAQRQEALLKSKPPDATRAKRFMRPAFGSSTFGTAATDRRPARRYEVGDERDNLTAWSED
jgi:hypothetical protein